ncbi:MAG: putative membrane protein [Synergistales bacterium 58_81]|nr:MAG: putative membrane protein [Synergistales bacterium 57_84]KUK88333.1 MAG: putative membrane protein [Synergistales bacterium 58_81]
MASRILLFLLFILTSLFTGYGFRRLHRRLPLTAELNIVALRQGIQHSILLFAVPTVSMGSIWILDLGRGGLGALPVIGIIHTLAGGVFAVLIGKIMGLNRSRIGALFCCGFFSNLGSLGGLAVFLLFGEERYAFVLLYKLFIEVMFYGIGFPVAKSFSPQPEHFSFSFFGILRRVFSDYFIVAALTAMVAGFVLNLAGIPRPTFYSTLNSILIPANAFFMLFAIGLGLHFGRMKYYIREALATMGIKFLLSPLVVFLTAFLLGLNVRDDLAILQVVLVLSVMPPAYTATVPPSLYDLDLDMANSCWFLSTLATALVMPLLALVLPLLG